MKFILQVLGRILLVCSVLSSLTGSPGFLRAARADGSDSDSASAALLERQPASQYGMLSEVERERMNAAALNLWLKHYQSVKSVAEFRLLFVGALKKEGDRREMNSRLAGLTKLPVIKQDRSTFIVESPGLPELRVEVPYFHEPIVRINGVQWTFNNREPLKKQIELLEKKLNLKSPAESVVLRLALPKANAITALVGQLATTAFATILTVVLSQVAVPTLCSALNYYGKADNQSYCWDYLDHWAAEQAKHVGKIGKVDAIEKKDTKPISSIGWFTDDSKTCPVLTDKTKSTIVVDMREAKVAADGKGMAWNGDWFSVVERYDFKGLPIEFVITAKGTNTTDPNWRDKATNVLTFENGLLSKIQYRNPNYDPKQVASPFLEQPVAATSVTNEQSARIKTMSALVNVLNETAKRCTFNDAISKIKETGDIENPNPSKQLPEGTQLPGAPDPDTVVK